MLARMGISFGAMGGVRGRRVRPVQFRAAGTTVTYGSRTNTVVDAPNYEPGDTILVALFLGHATSVPAVTAPIGFSEVNRHNAVSDGDGFRGELRVYRKRAQAGEPASYTFTHSAASTEAIAISLTQSDNIDPVVGVSKALANTGTSVSIRGQVVRRDGSILVYVGHGWQDVDKTPPSGMTERMDGTLLNVATQEVDRGDITAKAQTVNGSSDPWSALLLRIGPARDPVRTYPDADTTGVPAGTSLTPSAGVTTSTNGQIIQNLEISGNIDVNHANVIIRRCKINGVVDADGAASVLVEDCEIDGQLLANGIILGPDGTARRNNIYGCENGIAIGGSGCLIEANYIHDLESASGDPHYDGIQGAGGFTGLTIRRNAIESFDTSCIILQNEYGGFGGVLIEDNLLTMASGAAHIYLRGDKGDQEPITDAIVQRNEFAGTASTYYDLTSGPVSLVWASNANEFGELIQV